MQNTKFYAILLVFVTLAGIVIPFPAISSLITSVIIQSSGEVLSSRVTAISGSAEDIQAAVDLIVTTGDGIGNVFIPEGIFNFVEVGELWNTVEIPAGVNLFGAPTERDANGQVIEWKTILVMPYEAPEWSRFFTIVGNGEPTKPSRFSDIKLVGWRYYDVSSTTMYDGVVIERVLNFRVDHCNFQDMAGSAIWAGSPHQDYNDGTSSGVIDHCRLVNTYGVPAPYASISLGYGIAMRRWACDVWEPTSQVWGHYTDYTIVIEDNYFSKWRHATCTNDGIHQIVRYNIFEGSYGRGEVDGHGSYADDSRPYAVGTRCMEVYENIFRNPDTTFEDRPWAINLRGGSGLIYNNVLEGYYGLLDLNNDWGNYEPYNPECAISETYIWNNDLGTGVLIHYNSDNVLNEDYFLYAPTGYTPYPYPHPLTLEATP